MTLGTFGVVLLLAALTLGALGARRRQKKNAPCGGACQGCAKAGVCGKETEKGK